MRVDTIMTREVVTVAPETTLKEAAALMAEHAISGLPVVADGRVLGVLSQSDIVAKETAPEEARPGLFHRRKRALQLVEATTAREAMNAPAITIDAWMSATAAATLMAEYDVNRLPVVDRDRLVGIVARADLVRAFARSDAEIQAEILDEVLPPLLLSPNEVAVAVERGEVTLRGVLGDESDVRYLPQAVQRVAGVVRVHSELRVRQPEPAHERT
jgi:CBS domain-containing protein